MPWRHLRLGLAKPLAVGNEPFLRRLALTICKEKHTMERRSVDQQHLANSPGHNVVAMGFVSRWRGRLSAVADTLIEIFQGHAIPVPVPAPTKRRSPRR
jgi:hypothetical protein